MGTEVLRPQDFWADKYRPLPPQVRRKSNAKSHRRPFLPRLERPDQRRNSPSPSPLPSPSTSTSPSPSTLFSASSSPLSSPSTLFSAPSSPLPSLSPSPSTSPSPSPSPSPSTSQQPRELTRPRMPRRSFSVDELHYHCNNSNKFGPHSPQPQMGGRPARMTMRRRQSLDTLDTARMRTDVAKGGLAKKNYLDEDDVYAGSAFFVSPSPSSLPLPSFFNNNTTSSSRKKNQCHDSATRDLRRLLRLE